MTATARTLPARTAGSSARIASIIIGMCPPITSFSDGAVPRYGMIGTFVPAY